MRPKTFQVTLQVTCCINCPYTEIDRGEYYCGVSEADADTAQAIYWQNPETITKSCPAWQATQDKP